MGGLFDFVCVSTRTPHGGASSYVQRSKRNRTGRNSSEVERPSRAADVTWRGDHGEYVKEPFNSTPIGVNSISFGSPHVHPMRRTCGEPKSHSEIKNNTHPEMLPLLCVSRDPARLPRHRHQLCRRRGGVPQRPGPVHRPTRSVRTQRAVEFQMAHLA